MGKWHDYIEDTAKQDLFQSKVDYIDSLTSDYEVHHNWIEVVGEDGAIYIARYSHKYRYNGNAKWYSYKDIATPLKTIGLGRNDEQQNRTK